MNIFMCQIKCTLVKLELGINMLHATGSCNMAVTWQHNHFHQSLAITVLF